VNSFENFEHAEEVERLLLTLQLSKGTNSLISVVINGDTLRSNLISRLKTKLPYLVHIAVSGRNVEFMDEVRELLTLQNPAEAIWLTGLDPLLSNGETRSQVLQSINRSRDFWPGLCQGPVVFVTSLSSLETIEKNALDFWSWVSHSFTFLPHQTCPPKTITEISNDDFSGLDYLGKKARFTNLENRLLSHGGETPLPESYADWLIEYQKIALSLGISTSVEVYIPDWNLQTDEKQRLKFLCAEVSCLSIHGRTEEAYLLADQELKNISEETSLTREHSLLFQLRFLSMVSSNRIAEALNLIEHPTAFDLKIIQEAKKTPNFLIQIGEIHALAQDSNRALEYYWEATELAQKAKNHRLRADILIRVSRLCIKTGDFSDAKKVLKSAFDILKTVADNDLQIRAEILDVERMGYVGETNRGLEKLEKRILPRLVSSEKKQLLLYAIKVKVDLLQKRNMFKEAEEIFFSEAISLEREINGHKKVLQSIVEYAMEQPESKAIQILEERAIPLVDMNSDRQNALTMWTAYATLLHRQRPREALNIIETRILPITEDAQLFSRRLRYLNLLDNELRKLGTPDDIRKADKINKEIIPNVKRESEAVGNKKTEV